MSLYQLAEKRANFSRVSLPDTAREKREIVESLYRDDRIKEKKGGKKRKKGSFDQERTVVVSGLPRRLGSGADAMESAAGEASERLSLVPRENGGKTDALAE